MAASTAKAVRPERGQCIDENAQRRIMDVGCVRDIDDHVQRERLLQGDRSQLAGAADVERAGELKDDVAAIRDLPDVDHGCASSI